MTARAQSARGFTLLEVMIALAILAVGLVSLGDVTGGSINMHAYARRATEATLLLRGKMLDMEELLHKDGFSDFDDEKHGSFDDEGAPEYKWRAEILKPDIKLDADQLLGMLSGGQGGSSGSSSSGSGGGLAGALGAASGLLGGGGGGLAGLAGALGGGGGGLAGLAGGLGGGAGGAGGALAGAGPFAGLISGQVKTFVETLKKSVREVRITVSWQDGKRELSISASQQIVILPESVGKAQQTGGLTAAPGTTPGTPNTRAGQLGSPVTLPKAPSGDGDSQ